MHESHKQLFIIIKVFAINQVVQFSAWPARLKLLIAKLVWAYFNITSIKLQYYSKKSNIWVLL